MIDKTRLGISFFDDHYGGIYRKRSVLCIGRRGSGKTMVALQAAMQSVLEGERGLMLSSWHAHDLAIVADTMGFPLSQAVAERQIVLLEYADIMPTPEFEKNLTLPPESFMEFQDIVESNGISRVVIDTVLPWVAIHNEAKLPQHVYSFVHAMERMGVTAVFTLPKPVSALAFTLKNRLEEQIPVVFTLDVDARQNRTLVVNKYLGDANLPPPLPFRIKPGAGIVPQGTETSTAENAMGANWGPEAGENPAPTEPIKFSAALRRDKKPPNEPIKFSSAFRR